MEKHHYIGLQAMAKKRSSPSVSTQFDEEGSEDDDEHDRMAEVFEDAGMELETVGDGETPMGAEPETWKEAETVATPALVTPVAAVFRNCRLISAHGTIYDFCGLIVIQNIEVRHDEAT